MLIIQSGKDIFADFAKIEKNSKMWRSGITYNFYEEGNHAILNDANINIILQDVLTWIEKEHI